MTEGQKPVVLIVDDIAANIQILAACLNDDYRIKVATGGQACLDIMAEKDKPDLVLLDIEMPDIDGYCVCKQLKNQADTKDIPIIFVTAKDSAADEEKGLNLGAVDYISKPIRPAIVLARVNAHITLKQQRDLLAEMALHDQLTGLYNRYYLMETTEQRISAAKRHGTDISLLLIDLDHFKRINDNHGHLVGDEILTAVAQLLTQQSRREDIAARFGGEEFIMLLGYCSLSDAQIKAEKLRGALEALQPCGHGITVSIGATALQAEDHNAATLIARADQALYRAKELGRNRVAFN